mgnify:CR=1 FL=1
MIDLMLAEDGAEIVTAATDLLARTAPLDRLRKAGSEAVLSQDLADWGWFAMAVPPERESRRTAVSHELSKVRFRDRQTKR